MAVVLATLLCALLSLAMELAQLYTPNRVASLWDVLLNAVGAAAGALMAPLLLRLGTGLDRPTLADRFALLLLACWLAGRLHPYVPSLDLGEWRASLAPLLREPLDLPRALRIAVLWWLAGRLAEAAFPRGAWLVPPLIAATVAAAVPIAARALGWADVAGALGGLLLWALLRIGAPFAPSLGVVVLLALAVSVAQRWLPGRSAEITDALIALAAGLAARLTRPVAAPGGGAGFSPAPPPPRRSPRSRRPRGRR